MLSLEGLTAPHHIDGDDLRNITYNKDYSEDGRIKNVSNAQNIARYLSNKGKVVVVSLIAPYRSMREELKSSSEMTEIYVHTDEIRGRSKNHVENYEAPLENFIGLDTGTTSVENCVKHILDVSPVPSKELKNLDKRKTLAVDFDGVIHKYSKGFQGLDNAYDPPMDGALEVLQRLKDQGYVLKIMSSRPALVIEEWLEKYDMAHLFDVVSNSLNSQQQYTSTTEDFISQIGKMSRKN